MVGTQAQTIQTLSHLPNDGHPSAASDPVHRPENNPDLPPELQTVLDMVGRTKAGEISIDLLKGENQPDRTALSTLVKMGYLERGSWIETMLGAPRWVITQAGRYACTPSLEEPTPPPSTLLVTPLNVAEAHRLWQLPRFKHIPSVLRSSLPVLWIALFVLVVIYFDGERTPVLAPALPIDRAADRHIADDLDRAEQLVKEMRPLPSHSFSYIRVTEDRPGPGKFITGTAFAVSTDREAGYWITNHHVVEYCQRDLKLEVRSRSPAVAAIRFDHANDLALVSTRLLPEGRLVVASALPHLGEEAYLYGYPAGKPGVVSGRLLSRAKMVYSRRDGEMLRWVETARSAADMVKGLNGSSGGPMMNAAGDVIGVMVAGEPRRGRFNTVAPEVLHPILPPIGSAPPIRVSLQAQTWEARGIELMKRGIIVKTTCRT